METIKKLKQNETNNRCINQIIKELKNHPDYIHSEIFTWTDVVRDINDLIDGEFDEVIIDDLTKRQKEVLEQGIKKCIQRGYNYTNIYPYKFIRDDKNEFKILYSY
jgi:hypothetical protein